MKTLNYLLAATLVLATLLPSCVKDEVCLEGKGSVVTRTLDIADFSGIDLQGAFDLRISHGEKQKITATGHGNIIDKVSTKVNGGIWEIGLQRGCIKNYQLSFDVEVPNLEDIIISGSGNVEIAGFDKLNQLSANVEGSGTINVTTPMQATDLHISISGSGEYKGFPLVAKNCEIKISGSGNCEVTATDELNVTITGSGSVYYKGNPVIKEKTNAAGTVVERN